MTYLSVTNFWKHQDRNAWKKAKYHPPWFKHLAQRDRELDRLPPIGRLLFWELLATATRYSNVLEADLNWLSAETRIPVQDIGQMLPLLVKGGWLSETKSARRATIPAPKSVPDSDVLDVEVDVEEEKALRPSAEAEAFAVAVTSDPRGREFRPYDIDSPADPLGQVRRLIGRTIHDEIDLDVELRALELVLGEQERASLVAALPTMVAV